ERRLQLAAHQLPAITPAAHFVVPRIVHGKSVQPADGEGDYEIATWSESRLRCLAHAEARQHGPSARAAAERAQPARSQVIAVVQQAVSLGVPHETESNEWIVHRI